MGKKLPQRSTNKKVKYKGVETFVNLKTGEIKEMTVTDVEDRDFNFTKVWLRNFITSLEIIGNRKTKVAYWVIDHINKENQITLNYRQISEQTGISYQTVARTMQLLQDGSFLKKVGTSYMVNPDIVFRGTKEARFMVATEYHKHPNQEPTIDEQIAQIKNSIMGLTKRLEKLQNQKLPPAVDADIDPQLAFDEQGNIYERAK